MAYRLLHPHKLTISRKTLPKIKPSTNLLQSLRCQSTMASEPKSQSSFRHSSQHKQDNPHTRHPKFGDLPLSTSGPQDCALTGSALLSTPYFNKGAGFPASERREFKLTGLLPQHVSTLEQQVKRAYQQYSSRQDALAKNTFMTSLAEQNTVLYFRVSRLILFGMSSPLGEWWYDQPQASGPGLSRDYQVTFTCGHINLATFLYLRANLIVQTPRGGYFCLS